MKAVFSLLALLMLGSSALAQDAIALAIEGWRAETREGVTYYRCASQICAAGSSVSYKEQPHRPALTLAEFEAHQRGLAERNRGTGRIRDVRISEPKQRSVEGVRVLQVSREIDWTDNTKTFAIGAQLIGPDRSYTLVSDAPRREWSTSNFEGFLRSLVAIAGIKGR